ncbi:pentatricopeptide repeat-containing protein At5g66520-like [Corylus avellana]|uniref:pentatricopeptide repeat-containing protein At5g66520-like n=1 Tax=Corylus avellana TaxID=13451 RepID=UPI00286C05F7|nr:pentatricopeptide repeat-containing protein At5g66520-like [Corylus avellana]
MLFEEYIPANPTRSSRAIQQYLFSLLQSCNTLKKLSQIHAQIFVNGFTQKNYILVKLLSFYVASDNLKHALGVFENIENPSATIWNQMVRGHARSETPGKSIELYNRMVAAEAEPDGFTYSFLLSACARAGLLREGEQVHGRVLANGYCSNLFVQTNLVNLYGAGGGASGVGYARSVFDEMVERTVVSWNSLLSGYIRCGDIDSARRIFDEMPERNVISWTTMISGCAQNGRCRQALSLFGEMRRAHVELDQVALVAALSACAELGNLNLGRWIHKYIKERMSVRKQPLLVSLNNALIHMYASCGMIDEASKVFSKMPWKNTVSWTSIITGLAKQGRGEEALDVFRSMLMSSGVNQVRPDEITFIGVLCACSHAGFVDEGRHLFKSMNQTWGISPKIEHYGCMVDLLSRAGFLDEAYRLVETMPIRPNDAIWGALLGGCRIHKNVELASHVKQKLAVELDPGQAAGYLVLLSNVYATAKRWKDVVTVRQKMVEMGVKKPPGRSWVQINGAVHDFVAGDRAHKHAPLIYEMLGEITRQAQQEGYKMDVIEDFLYVEE